jgi:hypothetical protein
MGSGDVVAGDLFTGLSVERREPAAAAAALQAQVPAAEDGNLAVQTAAPAKPSPLLPKHK